MILDKPTRNNLVVQMAGEFMRSFLVSDDPESFRAFEFEKNRVRVCHTSFALAETYVDAMELHLGADAENTNH